MSEITLILINVATMLLSAVNIYNSKTKQNKIDIISSATFATAFVCFWYNVILLIGVTI